MTEEKAMQTENKMGNMPVDRLLITMSQIGRAHV